MFERVDGAPNVQTAPYLWVVRAQALALAGEVTEARGWAEQALEAYRRYTHPTSDEIAGAQALLFQLSHTGRSR